jgi:uncharacterized membrane-anchored protein YitT (DUF2179 family)
MGEIEIIGLIASVFILVSFLFRNELLIRLVNSIGATLFVIYGVIIGAWSVWILNIALLVVHIYFLTKPKKSKTVVVIDKPRKKCENMT